MARVSRVAGRAETGRRLFVALEQRQERFELQHVAFAGAPSPYDVDINLLGEEN